MGIDFAYDSDRAKHAVLWLLKRHGKLDRLKLIKLIFFADLLHIQRYGRPIIGGHYVAMEHGPVGSEFYDQIKRGILAAIDGAQLKPIGELDEDYLSETDLEVLQEINEKYGNIDTFRLRDMTHAVAAWKSNYRGGNSSYTMPYEDLLGDSDGGREMLGLIADFQEAERVLG